MKQNGLKALWILLLVAVLPLRAGAQTINPVPWADSFESYTNGTPIDGTNGWQSGEPLLAIVYTNSYTYTNSMPLTNDHTKVLSFLMDVSNNVAGGTNQVVWVDMMMQPCYWDATNDPEVANSAQAAVYINTNGHVVIRHTDFNTSSQKIWTEIPYKFIDSNQWVRIGIVPNYADNNETFRFFRVILDGEVLTNANAALTPTSAEWQSGGSWFPMICEGSATWLSKVSYNGAGYLDDFLVTTNDPYSGTSFTIISLAAEGGSISPSGTNQYAQWSSQSFNWTYNIGYTNTGYVVDGTTNYSGTNSYTFINIQTNHTIRALFSPSGETNRLVVSSEYGGAEPPVGTNWVATGSNVYCAVTNSPAAAGAGTQYVCTGWTGDGSVPASGAATNVSVTITNDSSIAWNWKTQYLFSASNSIGGSVDVTNGWYDAGSNAQFSATASNHYHFAGWTGDITGNTNSASQTQTMDRARSVMANFSIDMYTITASAEPNGTIAPSGSVQVAYGAATNFVITSNLFYHVNTVVVDGTNKGSTNAWAFTTVQTNHSISATFAQNMTTNSHPTPEEWLAQYYVTNNYENAAESDTDKDGFYAWQEYIAGTDPTNKNSSFRIIEHTIVNGSNRVVWIGGNTNMLPFIVRRSTNLTQVGNGWGVITNVARAANSTNTWYEPSLPAGVPAFYRIVATNAP